MFTPPHLHTCAAAVRVNANWFIPHCHWKLWVLNNKHSTDRQSVPGMTEGNMHRYRARGLLCDQLSSSSRHGLAPWEFTALFKKNKIKIYAQDWKIPKSSSCKCWDSSRYEGCVHFLLRSDHFNKNHYWRCCCEQNHDPFRLQHHWIFKSCLQKASEGAERRSLI